MKKSRIKRQLTAFAAQIFLVRRSCLYFEENEGYAVIIVMIGLF